MSVQLRKVGHYYRGSKWSIVHLCSGDFHLPVAVNVLHRGELGTSCWCIGGK